LGVSTLWLNPVLENDQPYESYHGYAVTEHYNIDKRFGDNQLFKTLVDKSHAKGMKVMKDIIFNHCGINHYQVLDLPSNDWLHIWPEFQRTNHRYQTLYDPYASEADKKIELEGWFEKFMPDLNQQNPHLATYLIQNTIWWIEYSGIDAYRVDTYPYNDRKFLEQWAKDVFNEYPNFYICQESWVDGVVNQAHFEHEAKNGLFAQPKNVSPIDFQFSYAITEALNKNEEWTGGVNRIFHTLSQDYLFKNPTKNLTFIDNHDMTRAFSQLGENKEKMRSATAFLLTMRGIPQTYYGNEILMAGVSNPDGYVRADFPGGWDGDKSNKFTAAGRNDEENKMYNFTKKLANYRKNCSAINSGKLMQFLPQNGVYTYFRYDNFKTVMVVMNTRDKASDRIDIMRFSERIAGFKRGKNIIDDQTIDITNIKLEPYQTIVVELMR
jgi:neopullulanase